MVTGVSGTKCMGLLPGLNATTMTAGDESGNVLCEKDRIPVLAVGMSSIII